LDDVQAVFSDAIVHYLSAEYPVAIILGTPGSGKSTILRWLALQMARAYLNEDYNLPENLRPKQIPILLRISDYAKQLSKQETERQSLRDFLVQQTSRLHSELPSKLLDELKAGHCLVLLDGLDEVTSESMQRRVNESISEFVSGYSATSSIVQSFNRFVFTSRITGYEAGSFAKYAHYTLWELDNDKIEEFLTKWCPAIERHQTMAVQGMKPLTPLQESQLQTIGLEQKDDLLNIFDESESINRLATNPLMLSMLALVQRSKGNLPQRRIALYQIITRTLLDSWNKESGRNYIEEVSLSEHILSNLAYELHGTDLFLTEQSIKTIVNLTVQETTGSPATSREIQQLIETLRSSSSLIIEVGQGLYSFMHRTFQEYFVALYLLRMAPEALKQFIRLHYRDAIWHEPLLLAIAYKSEQSSREDHREASELIQCIFESQDEYDAVLHRNCVFAASSLAECRAWTIDTKVQVTIAIHLFELYGDALGNGRYTELQKAIEVVALSLLSVQTQGSNVSNPWPPFLKEWHTALRDSTFQQRQLGAVHLLASIAPNIPTCPQTVLHALIPPLIQLTRLTHIPLPKEIQAYLSQIEIQPTCQRVEEYAYIALCLLHASGPIGWLDAAWDLWKVEQPEKLKHLKQHGEELGYVLPPFDIEKKIGNEKRRSKVSSSREVSEELLMRLKTVRQPLAYLLMQILNKEETVPEVSWRTVWDRFLQEEMNHGFSFTFQASLDLRLLLREQDKQAIKDITNELIEALSVQSSQRAQVLITITNMYLQTHLDLSDMSGLVGMPDLRSMRRFWTKWDTLDLHGMPGMRGLRELLILRYMRVILDRADVKELIDLLDHERILNILAEMLEQDLNIFASEILLCLYSMLTLFDPIPLPFKSKIQDALHKFERQVQSHSAEDHMLLASIDQTIKSSDRTSISSTTSSVQEISDVQAIALLALKELNYLTKEQVEMLLTSCADTREVTEERNLEYGPDVRSIAWRLVERQYKLDDDAFLSVINTLDSSNPLTCAAAALFLQQVKTSSPYLLKKAINKIRTLLSDEMLSSRPLEPPDYKYWRLDDILFETLKFLVV
jgi:hypothetical protein